MNIFIRTNFSNKLYNKFVDINTSINDLIIDYLQKYNFKLDVNDIYVIYNTRLLNKYTTLCDNNIENNSTLFVNYSIKSIYCSSCSKPS